MSECQRTIPPHDQGCGRGAPHDGPFRGPELECTACRMWARDPERCRRIWANPPSISLPAALPPAKKGPGTHLKELLATLGIQDASCGGCTEMVRQMDAWGADGCRIRHAEIVARLRQKVSETGWLQRMQAAARGIAAGLAFTLSFTDPAPGLVDEAIRRAASDR